MSKKRIFARDSDIKERLGALGVTTAVKGKTFLGVGLKNKKTCRGGGIKEQKKSGKKI